MLKIVLMTHLATFIIQNKIQLHCTFWIQHCLPTHDCEPLGESEEGTEEGDEEQSPPRRNRPREPIHFMCVLMLLALNRSDSCCPLYN